MQECKDGAGCRKKPQFHIYFFGLEKLSNFPNKLFSFFAVENSLQKDCSSNYYFFALVLVECLVKTFTCKNVKKIFLTMNLSQEENVFDWKEISWVILTYSLGVVSKHQTDSYG